jgi:serine O-acetyltransferase
MSHVAALQQQRQQPQPAFPQTDPYFESVTRHYLREHPGFVDYIAANDRALARYLENPLDKPEKRRVRPESRLDAIEELATYPGVIAVAAHQQSHALYERGEFAKARAIAEAAHRYTGIDLHPGTKLGENLLIDHGTAVVIGEQAKVGDGTVIYHDSTLGAFGATPTDTPRHPSIGDNCTVSVGVEILGFVQAGNNVVFGPSSRVLGNHIVIGNNVRIGPNVHINDHVTIGDGVRIGADTVIMENSGAITQEDLRETGGRIPACSRVGRDADTGRLKIESNHSFRVTEHDRTVGQPQRVAAL